MSSQLAFAVSSPDNVLLQHGSRWRSRAVVALVLLVAGLMCPPEAAAQNAELSGYVRDAQGAVVVDAVLTLVDQMTARGVTARTNDRGIYTFASIRPSTYNLRVSAPGFASSEQTGIILNVSQRTTLDVELSVAAVAENVTVSERPVFPRSTDGSVGTVIDRKFAANLPVNGRTFGSLLALAPGVTPAVNNVDDGQYSVNGQRSASNYLMVDGVAATAGMGNTTRDTLAGQRSATTVVGGFNGLVTMDALQEIRIQTSTFAPEFGRTPGGQVSLVTRSGTNVLHGSAFEQFRDEGMAANNWFSNSLGLDKAELSQHQFGATVGGPLVRNRTFFFGSYEGLVLEQPRTLITGVPSREARQQAGPTRDFFNAFPEPTGPNRADGSAEYAANVSTQTDADTWGLRVDHALGEGMQAFARYSHAPSSSRDNRILYALSPESTARSITTGLTAVVGPKVLVEARVIYSRDLTIEGYTPASPALRSFFPSSVPASAYLQAGITNMSPILDGHTQDNETDQWNAVASASYLLEAHHFKFGVDYRGVSPTAQAAEDRIVITGGTVNQMLNRTVTAVTVDRRFPTRGTFETFSLFLQDTWKVQSRLSLSYGVRWDINFAPRFRDGEGPLAARFGVSPSELALVNERNVPLWKTRYDDFAPRLGFNYVLSENAGLTLSGGVGRFGDLQGPAAGIAFSPFSVPNSASIRRTAVALPLSAASVEGVSTPLLSPPFNQSVAVVDPELVMPHTTQANLSVEKRLAGDQSVSATYVVARGRRLLQTRGYRALNPDFTSTVFVTTSTGRSEYDALQLEYRRRAALGLQVLAGYTLGRSNDTSSATFSTEGETGMAPSSFDVRHVFNLAASWDLPNVGSGPFSWALRDWGVHARASARSGAPFTITATSVQIPGDVVFPRASLVPGEPIIVEDATAPGGQRFNRAAFIAPPAGQHGDTGRNAFRGFAAYQVDLGLQRSIRLAERLRFQIRVDTFNLLNNPSFGQPIAALTDARFGTPTTTLNESGGFDANRLYRQGGPRTVELSARIEF
jgi:hypothetical protein